VLQAAAVIGTEVTRPLLLAIADEAEAVILARLGRLSTAGVLIETSAFPQPQRSFPPAPTLPVAYPSGRHKHRRALHRRVLEALEVAASAPDQTERLAHHAARGEEWDRAARYAFLAGERALAHSAYAAAVSQFEAVIQAVHRQGEAGDQRVLLDAN